jgi:hypothetical protein
MRDVFLWQLESRRQKEKTKEEEEEEEGEEEEVMPLIHQNRMYPITNNFDSVPEKISR